MKGYFSNDVRPVIKKTPHFCGAFTFRIEFN